MNARAAALAEKYGALAALLVVAAFAALRYEGFLTPENLLNLARQNSMLGFVAVGMTFVILTGGVDLSVGSLVAVAGVVAAEASGRGLGVALGAAVLSAALLGLVNGLLVSRARIQPFVATLAMMIAARGVALALTGESSVRVESLSPAFAWLGRGSLGPIPVPVALFAATVALAWLALRHTAFGRHVYAVGDNEEAARLMGLNVGAVRLGVYTLSGALAGLAGAVLTSRLGAGQPVAAAGWELDAIAAAVVGGTRLSGGRGGVLGTVAGLLLLGVLFNVFNFEGTISSWWQWVLRGAFLLLFVVIQAKLANKSS